MPMSPTRWTVITESRFPWERDALEWLRSQLPDHNPWHAWTNFEFIDDEGRVNEVDALILPPAVLYLMEIKSRPGVLTGDPHTWTWTTDGKPYSDDNPLILADRKAKRLAILLRRLPAVQKSRARLPFIRPCVFLSAAGLVCKLSGTAAAGVYLRGQPGSAHDDGIRRVDRPRRPDRCPWLVPRPGPRPEQATATGSTRPRPASWRRPWPRPVSVPPTSIAWWAIINWAHCWPRARPGRTGKASIAVSRVSGAREPGTGNTALRTVGTLRVQDAVEDPGRVYLAPESAWQQQVAPGPAQSWAEDSDGASQGAQLDVFSLGAIACHLFAGQPPAANLIEQLERLRARPGFRLSDVMDGAVPALKDLIQLSTLPDTSARYPTVDDFLKDLDVLEDVLTTPDPEVTVDSAIATTNDRLEGGFTVLRRLGKGSSSDVLLVRPDGNPDGNADGSPDGAGTELVLKVASDPSHNDRLVAEGEALAKLHRNPNVVEWRRTLTIAGRTALLLGRAGDQTLAKRLEDDTRLFLDLASRFGEELIQVVDCLEGLGIAHRDIKPQNIGIARGASGRLQLVLFDFSLTGASPEHIAAGTHPYLDPFLPLRRPPRWDLAAERFAVAVTLYEMLVEPQMWT